jgi:phytoene desaturase
LKRVAVIGAGFSGMAAATALAQKGYIVDVYEKNNHPGGRAQWFEANGFTFDMGPSWYWMPDVFEKYFAKFNKTPKDYYELERLDPSYQVIFKNQEHYHVPAKLEELYNLFDSIEPGASVQLKKFLQEAAYKYKIGINELVYKPGKSITEFLDIRILKSIFRLDLFKPISKHIRSYFNNPKLIELLEFPVLFLGAKPSKTPALYSLMNYADIQLGTWYPQGGMKKISEGMHKLALEQGVTFHFNNPVTKLVPYKHHNIIQVSTAKETNSYDFVIGAGDYHHIEQHLLTKEHRTYTEQYWNKRTMAPSSLIFYVGLNKLVKKLLHHNLFFDEDFNKHAAEIYDVPVWPEKPLFYVCCPSKTDNTVAPEGHENLFILIPLAPGLEDTEEKREALFKVVWKRFEKFAEEDLQQHIVYKRSYAHKNFIHDYNSYKGNAYGLANTLFQTAILKPSIQSKKIKNLIYAGQLTVPGPGVPPALISGQLAAQEIFNMSK